MNPFRFITINANAEGPDLGYYRKMSSKPAILRAIRNRVAPREKLRLWFQEAAQIANSRRRAFPRLFNLDLHVSVISDLQQSMPLKEALLNWSISNHNRIFRPDFPAPDPVAIINQGNWKRLDSDQIDRFLARYDKFLNSFDGFVVTYPTPFIQIFERLTKPIFSVTAIRYEWPVATSPEKWAALDSSIASMARSGQLHLHANNRADAEYMWNYNQHLPSVIPSVCDYVFSHNLPTPRANFDKRYAILQPERLSLGFVSDLKAKGFHPISEYFPNGYEFSDLANLDAVFFVPYNTSTMTLFELATLGTPVLIPENEWLRELADPLNSNADALSEIALPGTVQRVGDGFGLDLNDIANTSVLDWWLARADFADDQLMPNVSRVSRSFSVKNLQLERVPALALKKRNENLIEGRNEAIMRFIHSL